MAGLNDFLKDHNYLLVRKDQVIILGPIKGVSKSQTILFLILGVLCLIIGMLHIMAFLFILFGIILIGFPILRLANLKKQIVINPARQTMNIVSGFGKRIILFQDIDDIVLRKTKLDTGTDPFNDGSEEHVHSILAKTKKGKSPILLRVSSRDKSELKELDLFAEEIKRLIFEQQKKPEFVE